MAEGKSKSQGNQEVQKAQEQFDAFEKNLQELSLDKSNQAPTLETEAQTKLSQREIDKSKDIYLKPVTKISSQEKFNEKFREEYNFAKEFVAFIAEHKEIIGEDIEIWTKPFPGMPAEYWKVPTNKIVHGPRYLAEQIKKCNYHRFVMQNHTLETGGYGQMIGGMASKNTIQRLDALPVSKRKSVFMGASGF